MARNFVLLPNTALESALPVLEQLRESFEDIRQTIGATEFCVSFNCGVTAYPEHQTAEDILHHADVALHNAKHRGRYRVVVAD